MLKPPWSYLVLKLLLQSPENCLCFVLLVLGKNISHSGVSAKGLRTVQTSHLPVSHNPAFLRAPM